MAIEVVTYDLLWPQKFADESAQLQPLLAPWLVAEIEHVGSTAVPGLVAKPVIDIMAPVASLEGSREAIAAVAPLGYLHWPYRPQVMHWFCKPSATHRTHHLHLVPYGGPLWRDRLRFRDALRQDAALAAEYGQLKLALAQRYGHDREAYTEAKTGFVQRVLAASP